MVVRSEGLEEDVLALIRSRHLQDSLVDLSEAGIDPLLQEGFLRDVPLLGTVIGAIRTAGSIRDLLLVKKLGRFIRALQAVPLHERKAFDRSLGSVEERHRIGESLLLLLDRLDDMSKPELIGRLFQAYIRTEIDFPAFQQMATSIGRLHVAHIDALIEFYASHAKGRSVKPPELDVLQALSFSGLVRVSAEGDGGGLMGPEFAGAQIHYEQNELGARFVGIIQRDA